MYGLEAFLAGVVLTLITLIVLVVQLVAAKKRPQLKPAQPRALFASAVAFAAAGLLCFGSDFGVSGEQLDRIAIPVFCIALVWLFLNRLAKFRNNREDTDGTADQLRKK